MGKLIFAVVVFVVGFAVYSALKRQTLLTGPMAVIPRCRSCATSRRVVFLFEMQMTASAPVSRHTR